MIVISFLVSYIYSENTFLCCHFFLLKYGLKRLPKYKPLLWGAKKPTYFSERSPLCHDSGNQQSTCKHHDL